VTAPAPAPRSVPEPEHDDVVPEPSIGPVTVLRRLAIWTVTCTVSAGPGFAIALSEGFDPAGMLVGIGLFIVGLTAISCTSAFERRLRRPFVRATLYTGYGVRMALSMAFPLAIFVDIWPGIVTMAVAEQMGFRQQGFASALVHTVIQGALMNFIVGAFMVVVYLGLRQFVPPRRTRGIPCPTCGYDRRGSDPSSACPECGGPHPASAPASPGAIVFD